MADRTRARQRRAKALGLVLVSLWALPARAEKIIDQPDRAPRYSVELEPHGLLGPHDPPGDGAGFGVGAGVRVSIPVAKHGFIASINDSVAVGFGFDWLYYDAQDVAIGPCRHFEPGPNNTLICTEVAGFRGDAHYFYVPAVMQWNFWLLDELSVFGEPGVVLYGQVQRHDPDRDFGLRPAFFAGARWHFGENSALTIRLGYPTVSLGVSFLL